MNSIKYLFEIPVYRIDQEKYLIQIAKYIKKYFEKINKERRFLKLSEEAPDTNPKMYDHLVKTYGGEWRYNEVIGYIRLYTIPRYDDRILGELWWVDAKRIIKTRKKIFYKENYKCGFEVFGYEYNNKSDAAIFQLLLERMDSIKKDCRFRKYYVDDSLLRSVGGFIKWGDLLQDNS